MYKNRVTTKLWFYSAVFKKSPQEHFMQILHKSQYAIFAYSIIFAVMNMYKRIRELREDNDLSQGKLAEILKVSQSTYSRYESGYLDIPSEILKKIAQLYKVSTDYILELTDKK